MVITVIDTSYYLRDFLIFVLRPYRSTIFYFGLWWYPWLERNIYMIVLKATEKEFIACDVWWNGRNIYVLKQRLAATSQTVCRTQPPSHRLFEATGRCVLVCLNSFRLRARSIGAEKYELKDELFPHACARISAGNAEIYFPLFVRVPLMANLATLNGSVAEFTLFLF